MIFDKIKVCFKKKNQTKNISSTSDSHKKIADIIIPFYLNQRIIYDTLAIIHDGFTELYNVSNAKNSNEIVENSVIGKLETSGNPLTLMRASLKSNHKNSMGNDFEDKQEFQKVHTPTSLFSKVYNYLFENNAIKLIKNASDIGNISCGDFIEFNTKLQINTIEEGFRKTLKMSYIGDLFLNFGEQTKDTRSNKGIFQNVKTNMQKLTEYLDLQNEKIKYMVGKIDGIDVVIKIDRDNIINADYDQISNGNFRIVGKVLEVIEEGETINLNRESVLGMIKKETLQPMKEAIEAMNNTVFDIDSIVDEIEGKTIIIVPIVIGI